MVSELRTKGHEARTILNLYRLKSEKSQRWEAPDQEPPAPCLFVTVSVKRPSLKKARLALRRIGTNRGSTPGWRHATLDGADLRLKGGAGSETHEGRLYIAWATCICPLGRATLREEGDDVILEIEQSLRSGDFSHDSLYRLVCNGKARTLFLTEAAVS